MLLDLQVLERKKYNYLNDVMDISQQLAAAMDRNDQVSVRMLVAMRHDPLLQLEEIKHNLNRRLQEFSPADQELARQLLQGEGGASPREPAEPALDRRQVLLQQVKLKIGGKDIFPANFAARRHSAAAPATEARRSFGCWTTPPE